MPKFKITVTRTESTEIFVSAETEKDALLVHSTHRHIPGSIARHSQLATAAIDQISELDWQAITAWHKQANMPLGPTAQAEYQPQQMLSRY